MNGEREQRKNENKYKDLRLFVFASPYHNIALCNEGIQGCAEDKRYWLLQQAQHPAIDGRFEIRFLLSRKPLYAAEEFRSVSAIGLEITGPESCGD